MDLMKVLSFLFGTKQARDMKKLRPILHRVNEEWKSISSLSDDDLKGKTDIFRARLAEGESLDDLLPEAYAVVREATHRVLGERKKVKDSITGEEIPFMAHFDVQIIAAIVLHQGNISEMKTGEGKTQVGPVAAYLNALTGKGVHVITVNDYLAKRDSEWMGRIFEYLGLTVGCLDKTAPSSLERRDAYNCDITYGTNNEFGFDYLRDNMAVHHTHCVQRELNFAIIDEVDNILIDEARTPLIISGAADRDNHEYEELNPMVAKLVSAQSSLIETCFADIQSFIEKEDYCYEFGRLMLIAKRGAPKKQEFLDAMKIPGVGKAMKMVEAEYLREKKLHELDDELYYSIDESGHSAEMNEKGRELIGGSNKEFFVVSDLAVIIGEINGQADLSVEEKNEAREKAHSEYAVQSERIHCVSQLLRAYALFEKDVSYVVNDGQVLIVDEFTGRILAGRRYSDGLHQALEAKEGVRVAGESQTLATITFQNFFKMYNKVSGMTGTAATEAKEFTDIYELDVVQIPTNRTIARIDADDEIYKNHREKFDAVVQEIKRIQDLGAPVLVGTVSIEKSEYLSSLLTRKGVRHEVLNAKNHAREASIIAQAGRRGAVTIATNMAGRGTDIKLGGNFESLTRDKLIMEGEDPEAFTHGELLLRYPDIADQVRQEQDDLISLGGLHVVGTERHESRRIDNQLRGRAGRQGDPGFSRFYLSLDDDLMRIFGSERISGLMDKLGAEEGEVISHPFVSSAIGNAQRRVEGRNYEIRKHLKDYDDVMNLQRTQIYTLRQQVLRGEDVRSEILIQFAGALEELLLAYCGHDQQSNWNINELEIMLATVFGISFDRSKYDLSKMTIEELFDILWIEIKGYYEAKESRVGLERMRDLECHALLMTIDDLWKTHLYEMDHLKQGVQFRSFGQKNPLYEYQREGLKYFEQLRGEIAKKVSTMLFRFEIIEEPRRQQTVGVERHQEVGQFAAVPMESRQQVQQNAGTPVMPPRPSIVPVARQYPKVQRNEVCPCGSGKKYKKCHGANE